jgi:1-acyl-sn-glycerol-3-phosphate acyltransferase
VGQLHLLLERRFWPLFWTLFLAAFNDNVFRNALAIVVAYRAMTLAGFGSEKILVAFPGIFILPYFLFSATAGQLADRYVKAHIIRIIKAAEIGIMALAGVGFALESLPILLTVLFLMGLHAAFLGPTKFSVLPDLLDSRSLVAGNALVELGSFLAILVGTVTAGTIAYMWTDWTGWIGLPLVVVAGIGLAASMALKTTPAANPGLHIELNPIKATARILRVALADRTIVLTILGLSWFWALGAAFLALLPSFARDVVGGDKPILTLTLAVFCVGIGIGALLCERLSFRHLELGLVPLGSIGISVFAFDLGVASNIFSSLPRGPELLSLSQFLGTPGAWRILVDLLGVAVASGFYTVPLFTLLQQRPEAAVRSRVIAGNNIVNSIFIVTSSVFLMALLAAHFTIPTVFLVLALLNALVAIYIYTVIPEFVLRFSAWCVARLMYRLRLVGGENIPAGGPAILVANQVSYVDWMMIATASARPVRFVIDSAFLDNRAIRVFARSARVIPVPPDTKNPASGERVFDRIRTELERGNIVCLFPEGAMTRDGCLQPFRRGVEAIVRQTPVPVVPIAIDGMWGSYFSHRWGQAMSRPFKRIWSRVTITVGAPMEPDTVTATGLARAVAALAGWEVPEPAALPESSGDSEFSWRDQFFARALDAR